MEKSERSLRLFFFLCLKAQIPLHLRHTILRDPFKKLPEFRIRPVTVNGGGFFCFWGYSIQAKQIIDANTVHLA